MSLQDSWAASWFHSSTHLIWTGHCKEVYSSCQHSAWAWRCAQIWSAKHWGDVRGRGCPSIKTTAMMTWCIVIYSDIIDGHALLYNPTWKKCVVEGWTMLNPIRLASSFLASVEVPVQNGSPRATDNSNAVEEVERVGSGTNDGSMWLM